MTTSLKEKIELKQLLLYLPIEVKTSLRHKQSITCQ